ncbi:MAG: ATP synthase F1 subunit gamma [Planctomycetota bacterium]|nr:ATP synthase F1 subunit gamma [Planctomycetota bacterium]
MAQIREIKKRMIAVRTIQRITKTMQMIATAKFTASLAWTKASRPYTDRIRQLVSEVSAAAGDVEHPLLRAVGDSGRVLILVVGSDRGLCGTYNSNILRMSARFVKEQIASGKQVDIFAAGKKPVSFFRFSKMAVLETISFGDKPTFDEVQQLAERLMDAFKAGQYSSIHVASTRFVSNSRQTPEVVQLLPMAMPTAAGAATSSASYEFSPSAAELVSQLLPRAVRVSLFQAFNDAVVSENVMRMVAMKAATDNASDLGRTLKRNYNRARQTKITTELTEIISGAAALA